MVQVDEDSIWQAEKEKVWPGSQAHHCSPNVTLRCFKFLEANLTIQTDTRQLGKVTLPTEVEE